MSVILGLDEDAFKERYAITQRFVSYGTKYEV
jgi:hypothetical protein